MCTSPLTGCLSTTHTLVSFAGCALGVNVQPFMFPNDLIEGSRVTATCSLKTVLGGSRFKWLKDGGSLERNSNSRISVRTEADFSMITIDPVRQEDSGNYTCTVTSKGKSDSNSALLVVYGKCAFLMLICTKCPYEDETENSFAPRLLFNLC